MDSDLRLALKILSAQIDIQSAITQWLSNRKHSYSSNQDHLIYMQTWEENPKVMKNWAVEAIAERFEDMQSDIERLERSLKDRD